MPMLRYVVLRHEGVEQPHFDLMFETAPGSKLVTWRSDAWPIEAAEVLERLADHRPEYLDYEGLVSGNRGSVRRVASGRCRITLATDVQWLIELEPDGPILVFRPLGGHQWEVATGR